MKEELIAGINRDDIKYLHSGQISKYIYPVSREEAHKEKICHLIIRVFIIAFTPNNKALFLIQQRSSKKKSYPNYFTDSASGHVEYHNRLDFAGIKQNALRELEEEFAIPPNEVIDLKFHDLVVEDDTEEVTEVAYIFFGLVRHDVTLKPDKEELNPSTSHFYTRDKLNAILSNKNLVDHSRTIWEFLLETDLNTLFTSPSRSNTEFKVGLFIGRFQPLHFGHLYVIKEILKTCSFLKIAIGSAQLGRVKNDPFTGTERKEFLKVALSKRDIKKTSYEIFEVPDLFDADKWVSHVVSIVGEFNVVYSNSDWVRQLFINEGYTVGRKLEIFKKKFNGSNIRDLIRHNKKDWRNLVPNEVIKLMEKNNGLKRIKTFG